MDTEVSVSEEAEATFEGEAKIDDFRSLSGQGEIQASQRYSGSSGYRGSAVFSASGSGSLTGAASLSPGFLRASQNVLGSGDFAEAEMSLINDASSTVAGCNIASGSMTASQSIWTGSAHSSQSTSLNAQSGNTWQSTTVGGDTAFSRSGFGNFDPIHDVWSSQDGPHHITNDLSGSGTYSLQGRVNALAGSVSLYQLINAASGNLNSAQSSSGESDGENLLASDTLTASGTVSGTKLAISEPSKSFVSQQLIVNGYATAASSASASSDLSSSSVSTSVSGARDLYLGTFSKAYNNLYQGEIVHRTQAQGDAIGQAGAVNSDSSSGYLGDHGAHSHGQWSEGYGDLNIGSKTVKAATSDVDLKADGLDAGTSTSATLDGTVMSGLRSTASAEQSGDMKFESHLYSHSYTAYTYHLFDDWYLWNRDSEGNWIDTSIPEIPLNWEEQMSTASLGISGRDTSLGISRWNEASGEWDLIKECSPAPGEAKTFRAVDAITDWKEYEKKITGRYQEPWLDEDGNPILDEDGNPIYFTWDTYEWVPTGSTKKQEGLWEGIGRVSLPEEQVPWGIKYMYNNPDLTKTSGGRGVDVGVIDTGVDTLHPDLLMRIEDYFALNDFARGFEYQNGEPDMSGHGTHVSGTLAADGGLDGKGIYGMAPEAHLKEYNAFAFGGGEFCYPTYGLYRATDLGSDIISNSWSFDKLEEDDDNWEDPRNLINAIDYSLANDVLLVAGTGNAFLEPKPIGYPAIFSGVISVGALAENSETIAYFSARGFNDGSGVPKAGDVIFVAPGENVYSTLSRSRYTALTGTSMATPHISGEAAKLLSEKLYYGYKPADVKADLFGLAKDHELTDSDYPYPDNQAYGFGAPRLPEGST